MQPEGHHLAQLNLAWLKADPDDPVVAPFMNALDRVNGIGRRSPGFVWIMQGSGNPETGNTENYVAGDPRMLPNLTVWEDVASLEQFVWNTVHRQFYERRAEWFRVIGQQYFVMWWVPEGHLPTLDEGLKRLDHLRAHGDTQHAFGWGHVKDAELWKSHACAQTLAE